jgi:hypothetical protein
VGAQQASQARPADNLRNGDLSQYDEARHSSLPESSSHACYGGITFGSPFETGASIEREFITSGNYDDPVAEASFYADEVDYFDDGRVNEGFILNDIKTYDQRWPKRSYWLDGDPAITVVDSQGDVARAVVTLKFSVQNGHKSVGGSCEDTILIRDVRTNPKVISVKSRILNRYEKPNAP